ERVRKNVKWVLIQRGGNNYKEGKDPPEMSIEDWQNVLDDVKKRLRESLDSNDDPDAQEDPDGWIDQAEIWTVEEQEQVREQVRELTTSDLDSQPDVSNDSFVDDD